MVIFQSVFGLLFYGLSLLGILRQTGQLKREPRIQGGIFIYRTLVIS